MRSVNGSWAVCGDAQACLDHLLVLGERHLYWVIREYGAYFNRARPHQGIGQQIPEASPGVPANQGNGKIITFPVLNGLHHDYRLAGGQGFQPVQGFGYARTQSFIASAAYAMFREYF